MRANNNQDQNVKNDKCVIFPKCDLGKWENAMESVLSDVLLHDEPEAIHHYEEHIVYYLTVLSKWIVDDVVVLRDGTMYDPSKKTMIDLRHLYYRFKATFVRKDIRVLLLDICDSSETRTVPNKLATGLLTCTTPNNVDVIVHLIFTLWQEEYFFVYNEGNSEPFTVFTLSSIEKRHFYRNGYILSPNEQMEYVKKYWFGAAYLRRPDRVDCSLVINLDKELERAHSLWDIVQISTKIASLLETDIPFICLAYKQMLAA